MSYFKNTIFYGIIASLCCPAVYAADLKTEIKNLSPNAYWTLQNTFSSELPSTQPINFIPSEQGGANAMLQGSGVYTPDYFPVTPLHLSPVPENNGLWLGETTGDLVGVKRYLSLTSTIGGQQPGTAFNINYKDPWTLHLLVSPDPDVNDARSAEVVFYAGAPAVPGIPGTPAANVQVVIDTKSTGTQIKLLRDGQGTINGPQLTIAEAAPGERHWYHIIVRYGLQTDTTVTELTLDVNSQSTSALSNQSLFPQAASPIIFGRGSSQEYFNGAIQHAALWKRKLTNTEVATLKTSLTVAPSAIAPLTADSNQEPRYFMWTVPTRETTLTGRDGLNWQDPLWQIEGVYPMVRHKMDYPMASNLNAPGTAAQLGNGPGDVAKQSYGWIKYIDNKLQQYTSKSLNDGMGYSLFLQDWGWPAASGSHYADRGAARGLMQNWRDAPSAWRNGTHDTSPTLQDLMEINTPFYREGMSQNAFRTAAMFKELNSLLLADSSLTKPSRLHFDIEHRSNLNNIGEYFTADFTGCVDNDSRAGWYCAARLDSRAASFDNWGVKGYWGRKDNSLTLNNCLSLQDTLDSNGEASTFYWGENDRTLGSLLQAYQPKQHGVWQLINSCFQEEFYRFGDANYYYAISEALKKPAVQMLNSNIRVSEFAAAATAKGHPLYSTARDAPQLGDGDLGNLDFSSPVLYPMGKDAIDGDLSLQNWQTRLNPGYSISSGLVGSPVSAPAADVKEALDNLYVETQKHNINIAVKAAEPCATMPQSPWLPYPGHTVAGLGYSNLPVYTLKWQEVARLAVFSYRRGAREFLLWGDDSLVSGTGSEANLIGLEKVYAAVNYAKTNALDFTTTGATSRSQDNFGVPDGVIDVSDYQYYIARYNEGDAEADLTSDSSLCAHPDGKVTSHDLAAFAAQTSSQYFAYQQGVNGGNLTSIAQINSFINGRTPEAKFLAKTFYYGSDYAFEDDLGHATNLQSFLASDAASLSADPGESSDAILRMYAAVELPAGTYNFKVRGDDGYQIKVDGQVRAVVDTVQAPTDTEHASFTLATGGIHLLEILYWDQGYQAVFKAEISGDNGTSYDVLTAYQ